jgi:PAS domain S-box-containing protein
MVHTESADLIAELRRLRGRAADIEAELLARGERVREPSAQLMEAVLDALPEQIAVLDGAGQLLEVNESWRRFGGGSGPGADVGGNYLEACDHVTGDGAETAQRAAQGIRAVLASESAGFTLEYSLSTPAGLRFFSVRVSPFLGDDGRTHAVVAHHDITSRREAEEAAHRSERRFRRMVDRGWDLIGLVDERGIFTYMSGSVRRVMGSTPEDFVGRNALEILPPDDREKAAGELTALLAAPGAARTFEARLRHKDGRHIWLEIAAVNLLSEPDLRGILTTARDITARKQAEEALQRQSADLERRVAERTAELGDLYDNAPCGYHTLTPDGAFAQVNQTELRWLGYERDEVIGRDFGAFMTPSSRARFEVNLARARGSLEPELGPFEYDVVRKDGSTRAVLVSVRALRDERGRLLNTSATLLDMTERRRAELALLERESSLQDFLDNGSDLIHSADRDGRFVYVNRAFQQALGYSLEDARELTLWDVIDPLQHEAHREVLEGLFAGRPAPPQELVLRTKSGRAILVEGHVSARLEAGRPAATRGFFHDVTRSREAEAALRRSRDELSHANAALERANRAKDEFLASMSHELRTPLNAVLGLSEALQEEAYGELGERQRKAVRRIEESGRHLLALINDILDLSKIEAGKMVLELAQLSVDDVCRASLRLIQEAAHKKRISVSFQVEAGALTILGDERRLKQILVNLLSNAVKFTAQAGSVGLDVAPAEVAGDVRFTVWDTGIGIPEEEIERLFQPFVQLDSSLARQHAGTGLGLALVRRLVDLHGGGITVESEPGKGSRFSFVLPGRPPASDAPGAHDAPRSARALSRALLVTASAQAGAELSRFLLELGVNVVATEGRGDVTARAAAERSQLIFLDAALPGAAALAATLRKDPPTRALPLVLLGAPARAEDAAAIGADEALTLPPTREAVRALMAQLGARHADPAARRPRSASPPSGTRARRVLVAEDDETNVTLIVDFLEARSYDVFVARNGREAVDMTRDLKPDLILMDIQMPVMDGLSAIREIRGDADAHLRLVPIIAVTALAMAGDRERCLGAGASDYLAKPIGLRKLAQLIDEQVTEAARA